MPGARCSVACWATAAAGHSKFDALGLRILLYVYRKSWDLKGDPLYMELSEDDQFRNGFVGLCMSVRKTAIGLVLSSL